VIDIIGVTHLDIIILSRGRRLSNSVVGYLDVIVLSGSGRTGVSVVGHRGVVGSFRD
jgi:hypothetical protein